jgi:ACS family hexuronate transporter-like MFS transporter
MSTSWQPPQINVSQISVRTIANLRWWIGGLLFLSTIINYIDRQTLSLLAPFLKQDYHWTNTDYANLLIGFRVGYSIGQTVLGRLVDRIGTRRGLSITVFLYSIISVATSLARGFCSFAAFRCLSGTTESANWSGATKAVSEWFPKRERGLATALFDSGSSVGGAIAPFIILGVYFRWGRRLSFILPGLLGFLWLFLWRKMYYTPQEHPRISQQELQMILADSSDTAQVTTGKSQQPWQALLKLPQTWGTIIAKTFTDPVWFFVTD